MTDNIARFETVASLLPLDLREVAVRLPDSQKASIEEIHLRVGRPPTVADLTGERTLLGWESVSIGKRDIATVLEVASQASIHTVLDRMRQGFVTVRGGHRLGLCGSVVMVNGELHSFRHVSALTLRIARANLAVGEDILPRLMEGNRLSNTLILSPPGAGKTTLLRDIVRRTSDGIGITPLRVSLADERGEVAAMWDGQPQLDVGSRTDVMDGCPKGMALSMLLRGMSPQVLAADEITAVEDVEALEQAVGCGVDLLCTAHGSSIEDLKRRPVYRRLLEGQLFQKVVLIDTLMGKRRYQVVDMRGVGS